MIDINTAIPKGLSLVVTIVNRGYGEKIVSLFNKKGVILNYIFLGRGTASSEIMDYLGLGETERDIILSTVAQDHTQKTLDMLVYELSLKEKGNGIAFAIPINSVAGAGTLKIMSSLCRSDGGE